MVTTSQRDTCTCTRQSIALQATKSSPCPPHLGNVEPLDVADAVEREVPREGHRQVVTKRQQLAPLVRQVVDELRVLAVLPCECLVEAKKERHPQK